MDEENVILLTRVRTPSVRHQFSFVCRGEKKHLRKDKSSCATLQLCTFFVFPIHSVSYYFGDENDYGNDLGNMNSSKSNEGFLQVGSSKST